MSAHRPADRPTAAADAAPNEHGPVLRDVDEVLHLLRRWGGVHYDERVAQIDHALQCATLAQLAGASDDLVVAALLHDLGHLIELDRADGAQGDLAVDRHHEVIAATALADLYPPSVTRPIALHVAAKRYLCAVDPGYLATLSDGSVRSLQTQGGPMTDDEVADFERLPDHQAAAALRRWDDAGKVVGLEIAPLERFVPLVHGAQLAARGE